MFYAYFHTKINLIKKRNPYIIRVSSNNKDSSNQNSQIDFMHSLSTTELLHPFLNLAVTGVTAFHFLFFQARNNCFFTTSFSFKSFSCKELLMLIQLTHSSYCLKYSIHYIVLFQPYYSIIFQHPSPLCICVIFDAIDFPKLSHSISKQN